MWVRSPHISTHALTEGDCLHQYSFTCVSHFNSRPHGGRPFFFDCVPILPYFNSRPHGGRRFGLPDEVPFDYISTHALTEGDPDFFLFIIVNCISTHALTEGDCDVRRYVRICTCISTHALTEGDGWKKLRKQKQKISTHALTEGDEDQRIQPGLVDISTHALTEGDNEKLI